MPANKKKSRHKPARRKSRRPAWRRRLPLLAFGLATLGLIGLIVLTVVSHRVGARFEAREMESPSRLYGRAVALAPGTLLPEEALVARLDRLGYKRTRRDPVEPGHFRLGRDMTIYLRSFADGSGEHSARRVTVRLGRDRIRGVEDDSGRQVADAFLEPEILATLYGPEQEERTVLPLSRFPQEVIDAVLVTEDRSFRSHFGVDPMGMARAALANMRSGAIRQGGSTLTQQLAKNLFFDQQRTWRRKAAEAVVALILERRYSKDRILQAYLNEVYLGQSGPVSIRGFGQAAGFYFGKDVEELDLSEAALLAGLIRAPGVYNPFLHEDKARQRRDQVLAAMEDTGAITEEERQRASSAALWLRKDGPRKSRSRGISYLVDYARQMLAPDQGADLSRAGMRIHTTVDPILQRQAEEALTRGLDTIEKAYRLSRGRKEPEPLQGAMVVLDPRDGSVLAMVGGRDYATSQFNRITQARRQPGSLFKPFVYLAGFERTVEEGRPVSASLTPATQLQDEPLELRVGKALWAPANYDRSFRGPVTAQMALEQSLNVPTVRASQIIGIDAVVDMARRAGIETRLEPFPSLALGAQEVTPLEIAAGYATIAAGGIYHAPALVSGVADHAGRVIHTRRPGTRRAVSAQAAYLLTTILQGAMDRGTARSARAMGFTGTAAGKTGTTDDYRDAWFAGFTPDLLALVWVGFDDGRTTGLTGSRAALPIWVDFMTRAGAGTSDYFPEPDGIEWLRIDPASGGLARWTCPESEWMAFAEGTAPADKCELHGWFRSWRRTGSSLPVE